jgi:hypothetical protein
MRGRAHAGRVVLSSETGAGLFAVILAMAIAAALYFGYFQMQGTVEEAKTGMAAIDGSRSFACRTNRQTIERQIDAWIVNHEGETPRLAGLEADFGPLPTCPEGGVYSLSGRRVRCSKHP